MFDHLIPIPEGDGHNGLLQLPGRCDRMLPDLPDLHVDPERLAELARAMVDPVPQSAGRRNPDLPFGYALFGRFVELDLGFDPAPVESLVGPAGSQTGGRPPRLELDCVFGGRRAVAPPRRADEPAMAALAPVFHHARAILIDRGDGDTARETLVRHYQWIVLEDYLPRLCDPGVVQCLRNGGARAFRAGIPFLPMEWALAARHVLHVLDRRALGRSDAVPGAETPWGGWGQLLPLRSGPRRLCRRFGPRLDVPAPGKAGLAARLLLEANEAGLPSGQAVARAFGVDPLDPQALGSGSDGAVAARLGLLGRTPLWFYLLKEAEVLSAGLRLGPVGSHIVAETVLAALEAEQRPIGPGWRPTLRGRRDGCFDLLDLLCLAGECSDRPSRQATLH